MSSTGSRSFETGLMSLGDLLPDPATGELATEADRHRSLVEQAALADQLGFDAVHLGEHHFCDYMLSAPQIVLAAIAERAPRLKLSTAVTLLANLDPVRVAEDYATVDALSGGRVEIVTGRGSFFAHTFAGFGQDPAHARAMYDENVELLVRLLREENVTWSGTHRAPVADLTTRPRPTGELPVWIGAGSPKSAELAAFLGCRLMLPSVFGSPTMFAPIAETYREAWERHGRDPAEIVVGACCHTHVAATTEEARKRWRPHYEHYWAFVDELVRSSAPDAPGFPFDYDVLLAGPAICGSTAEAVDRIGTFREALDLDRQLFMFDLGGIDDTTLRQTLEQFGTEVLPQLT